MSTTDEPTALSEYEGQYEYEHDATLIMVRGPDDKLLYASINGAHYPLRPVSRDVFLNAGDIEVLFVRGDDNEIIGYRENRSVDGEANPLFRILDKNKHLPPSITGTAYSSLRSISIRLTATRHTSNALPPRR